MINVYTDTSVIGGCYDPEFREWSQALFNEFATGTKKMLISDLMIAELSKAPQGIKEKLNEVPLLNRVEIRTTYETIRLAGIYIQEGALTNKSYSDALHIALATIYRADVLASWNFKHIVNLNRIRLYNSINIRLGYNLIEIRTPRKS
jgi:predicted nucleic acid-binding protein